VADSTSKSTLEQGALPFHGEYYRAKHRKYQPVVVLVPFYGANKHSLHRHIEFLNESGFDAVTFTLVKESRTLNKSIISARELIGLKHIWADQIEAILNSVPGKKIIFAFSNPSASAIEAIVRRNGSDILGLICDSGPTANIVSSMLNYFTYEEPVRLFPIKLLASVGISLIWAFDFGKSLATDLGIFPDRIPLLSIRGWKDKIISTADIDKVFEPHKALQWQKLSLPKAGHLNGLRDFADDYKPKVLDFLISLSR